LIEIAIKCRCLHPRNLFAAIRAQYILKNYINQVLFSYNKHMKDLITITIAGILLYWVMLWPDNAFAELVFQDNKAMVYVKVFSF
jgi:hypothetical protein